MGFQYEERSSHMQVLEPMIQRRHAIVHNADLVDQEGILTPCEISFSEVQNWFATVQDFGLRVIGACDTADWVQSMILSDSQSKAEKNENGDAEDN